MKETVKLFKSVVVNIVVLNFIVSLLVLHAFKTTPMKEASPTSSAPETAIDASIEDDSLSEDPFNRFSWSNGAKLTCFGNALYTDEKFRPLTGENGEHEWWGQTPYVLELSLPEPTFVDDKTNDMRVYYPHRVKAGERGVVVVQLLTDTDLLYQTEYSFVAKDDLCIVYGSENPKVASGGEFYAPRDGRSVRIAFYTSAGEEYDNARQGYAGSTGAGGELDVRFCRYESLASLAKSVTF